MRLNATLATALALSIAGVADAETAPAGSSFGLSIEGSPVVYGDVVEVEGGYATADVVTEKVAGDFHAIKRVNPVHPNKFEDLVIKKGAAPSPGLMAWIDAALAGKRLRQSGELVFSDDDSDVLSKLHFENALLTEIALPALDVESKEPAYMTVVLRAESTKASTEPRDRGPEHSANVEWRRSDFRATLFPLDRKGEGVVLQALKVGALHARHELVRNPETGTLEYSTDPRALRFDDLRLEVPAEHAEPLLTWEKETVAGKDPRRILRIDYLDPKGAVLFSFDSVVGHKGLHQSWMKSSEKPPKKKPNKYANDPYVETSQRALNY